MLFWFWACYLRFTCGLQGLHFYFLSMEQYVAGETEVHDDQIPCVAEL